ncbi:MAG TPA: molybdopterin cofactor-binding domain-containing protein [Gemmataceae bacterium]|nr:molybdopterin cofactor-binding domain-containing protein [Gemmataceae bacterium]
MNKTSTLEPFIEPERYELHEIGGWELDRRQFFRIAGGGVIVALLLGENALAQRPGRGPAAPREVGAWLHVGEDSNVTVYTGKVEIGQNIRTSLTQVVSEELHTPVERIRLVMADTALTPYDAGTFGSSTTPQMASQLRRVAATAREELIGLAADQGKIDRTTLSIKDGKVVGPDGKPSFDFGDLTKGKQLMRVVGADAATTPADKWTTAGTSVPKVDGRAFVTGGHQYASDVKRPGMLIGKVLRPPSFKATLASIKTDDAEKMAGVTVVHDGDFVAVAAPSEHEAQEALDAIQAEWKETPQPSAKELFDYLRKHAGAGGGGGFGRGGDSRGAVEEGMKAADAKLEATYTVAYIAHAPLETRTATAEWDGGKLTVWTGTQRPFGVRGDLARALNVPEDGIHVIAPDMGSGYGGKHTGEAALEAARLAKAAGKPVKVVWTRKEEMTWAYFRPAGVIDVKGGVKKDGVLTAWECHNYNSGGSALATPYDVANRRTEFHSADSPLKQGSYRGLAATANAFVRESHMDDLAQAVGMDPVAFRIKNLKEQRLRAVLEAAADKFGWGKDKPAAGRGFGIACATEKGSYIATCAEVTVDKNRGRIQVERLVCAFDCGAVLNPDHLKNQIEGGAIMALGGALFEHIDFADGKILNAAFADYRVPRFRDAPAVLEVVLVDRKDIASAGAGETPLIATAPAIGNAVFAACGVRLRSLPMDLSHA